MFLITKTSYDNLTRNFQKIIVRFSCNQAPSWQKLLDASTTNFRLCFHNRTISWVFLRKIWEDKTTISSQQWLKTTLQKILPFNHNTIKLPIWNWRNYGWHHAVQGSAEKLQATQAKTGHITPRCVNKDAKKPGSFDSNKPPRTNDGG